MTIIMGINIVLMTITMMIKIIALIILKKIFDNNYGKLYDQN